MDYPQAFTFDLILPISSGRSGSTLDFIVKRSDVLSIVLQYASKRCGNDFLVTEG
jgi:hypothetical protein